MTQTQKRKESNKRSADDSLDETPSPATAPVTETISPKSSKRDICNRCHRPGPQACICEALPDNPILTTNTEIIILQHPKELKFKNRSVPILQLCMDQNMLHLCVGRRLGDEIDPKILQLLQPPNLPILVFPEDSDDPTLSLEQAKQKINEEFRPSTIDNPGAKVICLVLDATWKFGKEIHRNNRKNAQYPNHMLRVSLKEGDFPKDFRPRRFEIRTTPAEEKSWMSTAECVAFVLSGLESKPEIYDTIMAPLDLMVAKWKAFIDSPKNRKQNASKKQKPNSGQYQQQVAAPDNLE